MEDAGGRNLRIGIYVYQVEVDVTKTFSFPYFRNLAILKRSYIKYKLRRATSPGSKQAFNDLSVRNPI
jgi:hypothetical protein